MNTKSGEVSIIVPFYKGNNYLKRLLTSINKAAQNNNCIFEVILVNDSPDEKIHLPDSSLDYINIIILNNPHNLGIHKSRCNGLLKATNDWIIFLDQDDELIAEGLKDQIILGHAADVVVGNGLYQYGDIRKKIYKNRKDMNYLIQKKRFIEIRNLIPSPGECLIKKDIIPKMWIQNPLVDNGADDWYLWLLLFSKNRKFVCNKELVYIHNETEAGNLSYDLDKMKKSCDEMYKKLKENNIFNANELKRLKRAINFKYLQDTNKIHIYDYFKYFDVVLSNIKYKLYLKIN